MLLDWWPRSSFPLRRFDGPFKSGNAVGPLNERRRSTWTRLKWINLNFPFLIGQEGITLGSRGLFFPVEEWWGVGLQTVLSRHQVFFRFNKAGVVACFDSLQVGCFFTSQLPGMTIAQQEKFNYTIFSFPGRHDISSSLTVLSHWGYNQITLSWPLRVHKKGNLDLGNVIFPIKYEEWSPILYDSYLLVGVWCLGKSHCLSWCSLLRAVASWATARNFAAFNRVSNFSRFKPMIKR